MTEHDVYCRWPRVPCTCADLAAARAEARADEREKYKAWGPTVLATDHTDVVEAVLDGLRAKVKAVDPVEWALAGQDAGRMFVALIDEAQK